jgi:hypothetical protein
MKNHVGIIHFCPTKFVKWLNKKNKPRYTSCSIRTTRKMAESK